MDNAADDRYVPRDAFNAQKAKATGLNAVVTWQARRIKELEFKLASQASGEGVKP